MQLFNPGRRRGHHLEASGWHLWSGPRPVSIKIRNHRGAAGAERELEQVITGFSRQERTDVVGVDYAREVSASLHVAPAPPSDSLLRSLAVPDANAVEVLNVIALRSPQGLRKTNG